MAKAKEKVVEGEVGSPQPDELTDDPMTEKVPAVVPANLPAKVDSEEVTKLKLFIADETEKRKLLIDYIRSQLSNTIDYGSIHVKKDCPAYKNGEECKNKWHWSKPTLFKPGSEKICSLMKLTPQFFPDTMMLELLKVQSNDYLSIPLICKLVNVIDGRDNVVAEGRGIASVYKNTTSMDFDLNKQMKIAEKRAQTDAVLRLGFSYYFTQDLEDMPKGDGRPPAPPRVYGPADAQKSAPQQGSQPPKASTPTPAQKAPASASQGHGNIKFDVTQPLKFGRHKGKLPSDASIHPSWILFMLDKVDEKTGEGLTRIAHNKCDGFIMRYCADHNEPPLALETQLKKKFGKTKLLELTLQEKVQFCEIIEGSAS